MSTPVVSVVMGVYNGAGHLRETIDSVLAQSMPAFEFVIVDDGSTDRAAVALLDEAAARDGRIRLLRKPNAGLTRALIDGCATAQGDYIARVDAGDAMAPERLARQMEVLARHGDCVFVSSHTAFHAPTWELLWVNTGGFAGGEPMRILPAAPEDPLLADVPHHGSVMFRRAAYEAVGGYRAAFYYGQDWDLWYRLADVGHYFVVPSILYRARVFPSGISMLHAELQRRIAQCSRGAYEARRAGQDELRWLSEAATIRPESGTSVGKGRGRDASEPGNYFIAESLRRRRDPRCRAYFLDGIRADPFRWRGYIRLLQSVALGFKERPAGKSDLDGYRL